MSIAYWLIPLIASVSMLLTGLIRGISRRAKLLAVPNSRSSHSEPVPLGGGIAISVTTALGLVALWFVGAMTSVLLVSILVGGAFICAIGYLADRELASIPLRLIVQVVAAIVPLVLIGYPPAVQVGDRFIDLGMTAAPLCVIAVMWSLNLFNFMDGIDGLAASQALFMTVAGGTLTFVFGGVREVQASALIVAASAFGFLLWNWPAAKIFMGDTGSGFLGYVIAVLAWASSLHNAAFIFAWWVLGGCFFVDATITLLRRFMHGAPVHVAHRTHAYQQLALRWKSHCRVTLLVFAINLGWLLPMAALCVLFPEHAAALAAIALTPLVVATLLVGAGRDERSDVSCVARESPSLGGGE